MFVSRTRLTVRCKGKIYLGNPRTKGQQNGGVEFLGVTLAPENKEPPKIGDFCWGKKSFSTSKLGPGHHVGCQVG